MDTKKKLIEFKRKQRRKLLKKLQVSEPIAREKQLLKEQIAKAIEEQEIVKQKFSEKQQENINKFKELRQAFPELSDTEFTNYARTQLGLDVPKTLIEVLPEREKKLEEKIKRQPKSTPIIIDTDVEKRQKESIAKQAILAKEVEIVKRGKIDILKKQIEETLKQTKTPLDELKRKYEGKGNQGVMSSDKKIFREYEKLNRELLDLKPRKKVNITKKQTPAIAEESKAEEVKAEEAKTELENLNIPEPTKEIQYSDNDESLRRQITKLMADINSTKDETEKQLILYNISDLSSQIKDEDLTKIIDNEVTKLNENWEKSNKTENTSDDDNNLFGQGLQKLNKRNIGLYHIHHKNIKDKGSEFILTKKGMSHAGNLAKILHPKEFEKMLTFSLVNHIRKNKK